MNRKILSVIICVFMHVFVHAQIIDGDNGPIIYFEETKFDFDTILSKDTVSHKFKFTNIGNEPLIITNAYTSCGCTIPQWPKEPIYPKDSGYIIIGFHTSNIGRFNKGTMIKSNAVNAPNMMIRINGVVKKQKK